MINQTDIKKDIFRYAVKNSPCVMTLYHIPTKLSVKGEGQSQRHLEKQLLCELEEKINVNSSHQKF